MRAARVMVILAALVVAGQAAAGAYVLRPGDTLTGVAARNRVSVTDLAQPFQISLPAVSKHLKVLERAGLIARGRDRQWRPSRLEAGPLKEVAEWTERYRRFWEESYDRLDEYLDELRGKARVALLPRFDYWARVYGLPPDLLKGLAWYESGWQNGVVSPVGAVGIGQLMPFTSDFVSNKLLNLSLDPKQADDNIRMSARFLRFLLDQTGGVPGMAVAAYYQGLMPTRAGKLYDETKRYVAGVSASRGQF